MKKTILGFSACVMAFLLAVPTVRAQPCVDCASLETEFVIQFCANPVRAGSIEELVEIAGAVADTIIAGVDCISEAAPGCGSKEKCREHLSNLLLTQVPGLAPPPREVTAQMAFHVLPKSNNRSICVIQSGNFLCDESSDGDVTDTVPLDSLFTVQFDSPVQSGLVTSADFNMDAGGNISFVGFKGPFDVGGYDGGQGFLVPEIDSCSEPAVISFNMESTEVEFVFSDFGPTDVVIWEPANSVVGLDSRFYSLGVTSGAVIPIHYNTFALNFIGPLGCTEQFEFALDLGTGDITKLPLVEE